MINEEKQRVVNEIQSGEKAIITDIQRYSVHDGPGIRTIVFFKGCPLRCKWCENPETHHLYPEMMYDADKCIRCGYCIFSCPKRAIKLINDHFQVDSEACNDCEKCAEMCYAGARRFVGREMDVDEVYDQSIRDTNFYETTGGGVTLSGGEVLMQSKFAHKLLKKLHETGIHTAIETCGYADWKNIEPLLPVIDLFLYDVKHIDADIHKTGTGISNTLILENLKKIAENGKKIIIRTPVIPGFNDNLETIRKIAELCVSLGIQEMHLLAFHKAGMAKWNGLNRPFAYENSAYVSDGFITDASELINSFNLKVSVGGN